MEGYVLRLGVYRARELLGTVGLVQDVVRQALEVRKMRAAEVETTISINSSKTDGLQKQPKRLIKRRK